MLLYIYISLANEAVLQKSIAQDQAERAAALTQIANNNAELADAERRRANLELRQAQITQTRFISDLAVQELRDNEATLAALLALEVLPDSNGKNEWPYDPIAERALIAALDGQTELGVLGVHRGVISSLSFSKDGDLLLISASDGTAKLFDVVTRSLVRVFSVDKGRRLGC